MAFDSQTRNKLQRMVGACRRLLTDEFDDQLQGLYGIYAQDGRVLELEKLTTLDDDNYQIATLLRDRVKHLTSGMASEKQPLAEAVRRVLREQAFTVLNRFAALRMAEERGFVQECVGQGLKSKGFQVFETVARSGLGGAYERYVTFIHGMFDELSLDLGVLFDRWSPFGLLFPREPALLKFFDLLNDPELKPLWKEDETVGWIYQYFNDEAERKKMREESSAPRNSRELAVRNQFFTPRYVVEFLTDNTLGRIWYEMAGGRTALKEKCRYLVRRPTEAFLAGPAEVYRQLFSKDADAGDMKPNGWVAEAFAGQLKNLGEKPSDPDTRWVGGAIRPADFEKLAGEPCPAFEDHRLGRLSNAILEGCETDDTQNLVLVWAALSDFIRCDGSRGYSARHWEKLWSHFRKLAQRPAAENPSQEEILKQPVFIPHRPIKDPRNILMLDPACGSMHFGLYAFDLFEVIYEEAWELEKRGAEFQSRPPGMLSLQETYGTKEDFLKDVPRLIIEHNLHGIDIDPRCAQIAGLSLWLRAQKAWQRLGLKPAERPAIKRSNIVCAEPMPGEKELLREFVEREFPAEERGVCLRLLEAIFDKMQLAGEAGSLLKIEEEIRSAIEDARRQWQSARQRPEFFDAAQLATLDKRAGVQQELPEAERALMTADLRSLTSEDFWLRVEQRIYAALRDYAEQTENGGGFQRRLFAEDAARGFAFIDVCRKRYDVVVMNPPFGELAALAASYLDARFPACKSDYYPCFIERGVDLLAPLGGVGAITNRTGFFLDGLSEWRKQFFEVEVHIDVFCDLGLGVLDALVETAAYVIRKHGRQAGAIEDACACFPMLDVALEQRSIELLRSVESLCSGLGQVSAQFASTKSLLRIPNSPLAYRAPTFFVRSFADLKPLESDSRKVRVTNPKGDDFRYVRTRWEVPPQMIGRAQRWVFLSKGGEYSNYYSDIHLLIDWDETRQTYRGFIGTEHRPMTRPASLDHFFCKGLTFSRRTASRFSPRILPAGCIFTDQGPVIFSNTESDMLQMLAISNSRVFQGFLEMYLGSGDATSSGAAARHYEAGVIRNVPTPTISTDNARALESDCIAMFLACREPDFREETSSLFVTPFGAAHADSIRTIADMLHTNRCHRIGQMLLLSQQLELEVAAAYGLPAQEEGYLDALFGPQPLAYPKADPGRKVLIQKLVRKPVADVIQEAITSGITGRFITIKSYAADRQVEVISHFTQAHADDVILSVREKGPASEDVLAIAENCFSYSLGCAFGRWDIRYAMGEQAAPELPDPFAPLPVCPPGQLQSADGLPIGKAEVQRLKAEGKWNYPTEIPWDGILVDDPNHPLDIERRVREAIEIIWKDRSEAIEHEACEILGVKSLRDYFRKPAGFFTDHLKRYSKSRRQAPIYWPLSTASGSYTLWIYYHCLTDQTLFQCVNEFVKPKLEDEVLPDIERLRGVIQRDGGGSKEQREKLEKLEDLAIELKEFHDELLRVAGLPYKPNLNDGVLITACPLWKLFRLPKWQKDLKACWESLEAGEYDWAHMALTIRPDDVREKCKKDRSIAIAHGLEDLCEVKAPEKKAKRGKKTTEQMELAGGSE